MNVSIKFIPDWLEKVRLQNSLTPSQVESALTVGDKIVYHQAQLFLARTLGFYQLADSFSFLQGNGVKGEIGDWIVSALGAKYANPLPQIGDVFTKLCFTVDKEFTTVYVTFDPLKMSSKKAVVKELLEKCALVAKRDDVLASDLTTKYLSMKDDSPSMEGIGDLFGKLFRKGSKSVNVSDKEVLAWYQSLDKKNSHALSEGELTTQGETAAFTVRGQLSGERTTTIDTVIHEIVKDLGHMQQLLSKYSPVIDRSGNVLARFKKEVEKINPKGVIELARKHSANLPPSISESLKSDHYVYLGGYTKPLIVGDKKLAFNTSAIRFKPSGTVRITDITDKSLSALMTVINDLETFRETCYRKAEHAEYNIDLSDTEWEAFEEEIDDHEFTVAIEPFTDPSYGDNYSDLYYVLEELTFTLRIVAIHLLKQMVVTKLK